MGVGESMTRSLVLLAALATLVPGPAAAQSCASYAPGSSRFACLSAKNPGLIAKRERCKEEAARMGIRLEKRSGLKDYVIACMQRGRR